jgi:DNA repair exonuclease SbcCD ATPase subunit
VQLRLRLFAMVGRFGGHRSSQGGSLNILFQWLLMAVYWFWLAASSPVSSVSGFSDSPKNELEPNAADYPLTNMFLRKAGASEECPQCVSALHDFEKFHNKTIKRLQENPTNVIKLSADAGINAIVEKVQKFEKFLAEFKAENLNLKGENKNLTARVETLTASVETIVKENKNLTARVETLTARVETLTARVETLTASVETIVKENKNLTARVETLTARVETLTASVETIVIENKNLTARVKTMEIEHKNTTIRLETRIHTLEEDIGVLLLQQAVSVAVQAMLVIVGLQPIIPWPASNRFSALMRSDPEFQAIMKKLAHNQATVRCSQIDTMTNSRNKVERRPTDLAQFKADVVEMTDVLQRYNSPKAQHRTALWVLHRFEKMLREPYSGRPAGW